MKSFISILFTILFFGILPAFSQEANKWLRIEFEDGKFSIAVPQSNIIDAEKRELDQRLRIIAFENGVEIDISHRKSLSAAGRLSGKVGSDKSTGKSFKVGDFYVLKELPTIAGKSIRHTLIIGKDDNLYLLMIRSKTGGEKEVSRFLQSLKINGKVLFPGNEKVNLPEKVVSVSSLKNSPEVIEAEKRKTGQIDGEIIYELRKLDSDDLENEDLTHRALIIERPLPNYSPAKDFTGRLTVRLKIRLRADGQVGDIVVLSNTDKYFTKKAINSARKIKFVPARRDGEFVDSFQDISYSIFVMPNGTVIII